MESIFKFNYLVNGSEFLIDVNCKKYQNFSLSNGRINFVVAYDL